MGTFGHTRIDPSSFDYRLIDLSSRLSSLLERYRLLVSDAGAYMDPTTGITFLRLADNEGDSVEVLFNKDSDGTPGCSILNEFDDENGWIDLEGILPVQDNLLQIGNFGWLRKTVLTGIMKVGNVDFNKKVLESSEAGQLEYLIEEAYATRGDKLVTIVSHRNRTRKLSEKDLVVIGSARRFHHLKKFQEMS
jgi:hypothetical protein